MKIFTGIDQNSNSQTAVTAISTPAGKKYYNEGNLGAATDSALGLVKVDSALSSASANPVQNKIVTTALAGKAAAIHSHTYTDCVIGGGSESGAVRSLGARMPEVFGNVFHGLPASAVTIEKSTDSGATWADMGISDANKRNLVSCLSAAGIGFNIKSNVGTTYQFRVTIDAAAKGFYGQMDRIYMALSTNGTGSCWCSVYTCEAGSTTFTLRGTYTVSGWGGWNSVPFNYLVYQQAYSGRVRYIRLVFGGNHTSTTYPGLTLYGLFGTGYQKWVIPNQMNGRGVPYTVDPDLNTYFPALVEASSFRGPLTGDVTGNLTGNVTGNATTAGDGSLKLYAHVSNEVNFGGTSTVTEIYFGHRAVDSRPIPTAYWFGDGKAKLYAGDITLGSGKKLYFGGTGYYLELKDGNLHTNVGLYSDKFISARGTDDSGSSGGGANLQEVWANLVANTGAGYNLVINAAHIPNLAQSKITGLTSALDGKAALSHTHTKSQITDFPSSMPASKLTTARTINGTSFDGSANITTTKWGTARSISITDGTNTGTAVSVDGSAAVSLKLPATIKAKFVSSANSSASCFLMGDGSVTTKKNLTSVTHCGGTSAAADALLVPTMNTIAYWNGAYNSSGSSNLAYCSKGAFGTFAAKSSLAFSELTGKPTTFEGYGITGGTITGATANLVKINTSASSCWTSYRIGNTQKTSVGYIPGLSFLANDATSARMGVSDSGVPQYWSSYQSSTAKTLWHAGNSNLSTIAWACSTLTASSAITATGTISSSTGIYSSGYVSARGQDTSSDIALKKDFSPISNALDYIRGTHFTRFKWRDNNEESVGIIAQEEREREYGFLVRRHDDVGHLTYDYAASTALLGAALQEEDRKVEELKRKITELENEIKTLRQWR